MEKIIFLMIMLFIVQVVLGYFQFQDLRKNFGELNKVGRVGIGRVRKRLSAGVIVLIAVDTNDIVVGGKKMEGISVFAKFKPFSDYNGRKMKNIIDELENKISELRGRELSEATGVLKALQSLSNSTEGENNYAEPGSQDYSGEIIDVEPIEIDKEEE